MDTIKDYRFYSVKKDVSNQGKCSKTNYKVALSALDKLYIQPQQSFNINEKIANLNGYCRGKSKNDYLFYG